MRYSYPVVELDVEDLGDLVDSLLLGQLLPLRLLGLFLLLLLEVGVDQVLAALKTLEIEAPLDKLIEVSKHCDWYNLGRTIVL